MSANLRSVILTLCLLGTAGYLGGCAKAQSFEIAVAGGDVRRGEAALTDAQCGACHVIPGIAGARGQVGPRLDELRLRTYLAGRLPNTPDILIDFLQDPPALVSDTAMPNIGVTAEQARDMAAYLYTLE